MTSEWLNEYAGDVSAKEAYALLGQQPKAQLVDVRTKAEWSFVGVPDLTEHGREVILLEWQRYPEMEVCSRFVEQLESELERRSVSQDAPILFLCRSGARSLAATQAMIAAGWKGCRNITGGFEGPVDSQRHRGKVDGWKAASLPWIQS